NRSRDRSSQGNNSSCGFLATTDLGPWFRLNIHRPSTMVTSRPRIRLLYQDIVKIAPEFCQWTMARKDLSTVVRKAAFVVLTVVSGLWLTWLTAAPALAQNREPAPAPPASAAAPARSDAPAAPAKSG